MIKSQSFVGGGEKKLSRNVDEPCVRDNCNLRILGYQSEYREGVKNTIGVPKRFSFEEGALMLSSKCERLEVLKTYRYSTQKGWILPAANI